ncbi:MAG: mechanosensitive ion channel [Gammaproteobacteria bacterium]|nr:mechanosensitive ion channel [Gammaproteobacteria bacterium]
MPFDVPRLNPFQLVLTLLFCALSISGALAQQALAQSLAQDQAADPSSVIEAAPRELADPTIQKRIEDIYAQIDTLAKVEVSVQQGVVILSGQVSNEAQAQKALSLAKRLEGIVTVEDEIERTLDVEGNVIPILDQFAAKLTRWMKAWPLVVVSSLVLVLLAFAGHRLGRWTALWNRIAPNVFLAELMAQAMRIAFVIIGLVLALNLMGATTLMGTILGGAGLLGLAIGFAVRDAMENYISSIMLSLRQPFRANDHITINEHEGKVVRLTSRATILMTLDGNHLRIPNATVYKSVILNYTRNPERRLEFNLGVDAADDPIAAMATGLDAIRDIADMVVDPAPTAIIKTVGDSTIVITFMAWMDQTKSDFWKMRSLAIKVAKDAIEHGGFTLPEPLYRVRLENVSGRSAMPQSAADSEATRNVPEEESRQKTGHAANDTVLDVSPDRHIEEMVNDERSQSGDTDLLDSTRPVE